MRNPTMRRKESTHVGILITTFRRPTGLCRTLNSLAEQELNNITIEIHVIDNDCDSKITAIVDRFAQLTRIEAYYHSEAKRGVASARNHALQMVHEKMDYVAFIDDDELASPIWLKSLVETAREFNASIVQGPVEPVYENNVSSWFRNGRFTALGPFRNGGELRFGYSGNVLLSTRLLLKTGVRFDSRFDRSGGEDQHFFMALMEMGFRIVTSRDAIVFETIPVSRLSFPELMRRRYRIGATLTLAWRLLRHDRRVMPYRILIGAGHALIGFFGCLMPWHWRGHRLASHFGRIAYGMGQIAGAGGLIGSSYSTVHQTRLDRTGDHANG